MCIRDEFEIINRSIIYVNRPTRHKSWQLAVSRPGTASWPDRQRDACIYRTENGSGESSKNWSFQSFAYNYSMAWIWMARQSGSVCLWPGPLLAIHRNYFLFIFFSCSFTMLNAVRNWMRCKMKWSECIRFSLLSTYRWYRLESHLSNSRTHSHSLNCTFSRDEKGMREKKYFNFIVVIYVPSACALCAL